MASLTRFIERRHKLQINTEKSAIARPWHQSFLGFTVKDDPDFRRCIADKAVTRFKDRVRKLTRRHRGISLEKMIADLNPFVRGWPGTSASASGASCHRWMAGSDGACVASSGFSGRRAVNAIASSDALTSPKGRPVRPSSAQRDRGD